MWELTSNDIHKMLAFFICLYSNITIIVALFLCLLLHCEALHSMAKRQLDNFAVSDINQEYSNACVHGVISELSVVKESRKNSDVKYFNAKLTDGEKSVRMVSFEPKLREVMEKAKGNKEAVMVKNCVIKESTYGSSSVAPTYEIVASSRSKIELSPKKFKFEV